MNIESASFLQRLPLPHIRNCLRAQLQFFTFEELMYRHGFPDAQYLSYLRADFSRFIGSIMCTGAACSG